MTPSTPPLDIADLLNVPDVLGSFRASLDFAGIDAAPDTNQIAFPWNVTGTYELYVVDLPDGEPRRLTNLDRRSRCMRPRYSPDGRWIAFMRDDDGDELFQICLLDRSTNEVREVTTTIANREALEWFPDSRRIVYRAHVDGRLGIWVVDVVTGQESLLVADPRDPGSDHITPDVSPDGRHIAFHQSDSNDPANVLIFVAPTDGATAPVALETQPDARARSVLPKWSPAGDILAYTTDVRGRFEVALLPMRDGLQVGAPTYLTGDTHDETALGWARSGNLLFRRSVDSTIELHRADPAQYAVELIKAGAGVCYSAVETIDGSVAYAWTTPVAPQDLFTRSGGTETRHTHSLPTSLAEAPLSQPSHVWYPGEGDHPTPALLYRPASNGGEGPAIVWAHGGGNWQHLQAWDPIPQWFAMHGYTVLAPNARGSRGYGRTHREANVGDWGGKDLADHVRAADWLEHEGLADGRQIGIYGSSGGGYMTAMAVSCAPDRWGAGITSCGLVSLETFYRTTRADLRGMVEAYMGSPDKDPDLFRERSPLTHIDNIRAPLLVLHGDKDPRVPATEARLLLKELQRVGAEHDAHFYPDEGHGFRDMRNQADALRRMVAWFDQHLKPRT